MTSSRLECETSATVAVVMVVRDEPAERLQRVVDSLARQKHTARFPLVISAPAANHRSLMALEARGALAEILSVDNPSGNRSQGLNAAIASSSADVIVRVDARSIIKETHIARCEQRLRADRTVGVVGGSQF